MALIRLNESIVDMIVAKIPVMNKPSIPTGNTFTPSKGNAKRALSVWIAMTAYSPERTVKKSNRHQNPMEMNKPFLAISGDFAAAQR